MIKNKDKSTILINSRMERKGSEVVTTDDNNTLSFVMVSDQNEGIRYDWWEGEYFTERLEPKGAITDSLNTFFKDHDRSVDSAIGKVSNVRVSDKSVTADVTFGSDDAAQSILQKYREGILTDVSIGYEILEYETAVRENELDSVTVTSYRIKELSGVGIGFDKFAKKRSIERDINKEPMVNKDQKERLAALVAISERTVEENTELSSLLKAERADEQIELDKMRSERNELKRVNEIEKLAKERGISDTLRDSFVGDEAKSFDDFTRAALKELADAQVVSTPAPDTSDSRRDDMLRAIEDNLAQRLGAKVENPHKDANMFRGASLFDIAKAVTGSTGYDRNAIAERAMVSADFPLLLLNSGNRVLVDEFDAASGTYKQFVKEVDVQDFRQMTDITTGIGGRLDKIVEDGELKEKYVKEAGETWNISSFGNKFGLTREMIINDDLGAFTNMLGEFGTMAGTTANGIVYDLLLARNDYAGYLMSDGLAIFDGGHNNSGAAALDADTLSAGRLGMMKHLGMDGRTPLTIPAQYLIVGANNAQTAFEIINSTASQVDNKNSGVVNYHQGAMQIIVDAEITGSEWYLGAARRTIKAGYLAGTGRRPILKMNDATLTNTVFEGIFDFGVMAEDYRGLWKGN